MINKLTLRKFKAIITKVKLIHNDFKKTYPRKDT